MYAYHSDPYSKRHSGALTNLSFAEAHELQKQVLIGRCSTQDLCDRFGIALAELYHLRRTMESNALNHGTVGLGHLVERAPWVGRLSHAGELSKLYQCTMSKVFSRDLRRLAPRIRSLPCWVPPLGFDVVQTKALLALLDTFAEFETRHLTITVTQLDIGETAASARELAMETFKTGRKPPQVITSEEPLTSSRGARYSISGPGRANWPDRCDQVIEMLLTLVSPIQTQFGIWSGLQAMRPIDLNHLGRPGTYYVASDMDEWGGNLPPDGPRQGDR